MTSKAKKAQEVGYKNDHFSEPQPFYPRGMVKKPRERVRHISIIRGESVTDKSQGSEWEIDNIVNKFTRSGVLPQQTNKGKGVYADVTQLQGDLGERLEWAQNVINEAQAYLETRDGETAPATTTEEDKSQPSTTETVSGTATDGNAGPSTNE